MRNSLLKHIICIYCVDIYEKNPDLCLEVYIITESPDNEYIINGCLYCSNCHRYYPIEDTILFMQPDEQRKPEIDRGFLVKYRAQLPSKITHEALPFQLITPDEIEKKATAGD